MRGERVSRTARKEIDLVIIAARYSSDDGSLSILQGYERRGPIWGDVRLYTREAIADKIQQGKRVVTGRLAVLQGDFEVLDRIQLQKKMGILHSIWVISQLKRISLTFRSFNEVVRGELAKYSHLELSIFDVAFLRYHRG